MSSTHTVTFYTDDDGEYRVKVDAPGVAAGSAPIPDPVAFIVEAANELGLEVDDSQNTDGEGPITITVPAGA